MSGTGGGDIVHGAGEPVPRWWRRFKNVPLVILLVLSLVAAIVGWSVQFTLVRAAAAPAPVAPAEDASGSDASASSDSCRPAVEPPASEPWIDSAASSETIWADNSAALAEPFVQGRDGWVFWNDETEESFSQSIGRRLLTVSEVDGWRDYLTSIADGMKAAGVELSIQIAPSAASIYPEQLPEWTDPIQGSTPLDQLLVATPDLPIVDFRADLRAAAATDTVFTPVNSHWTDWAGYIAWQSFAGCHDALAPGGDSLWVPAVTGDEETRIYNEFESFGMPNVGPKWNVPSFVDAFAPVTVTDPNGTSTQDGTGVIDLGRLPASTSTEGAHSDQVALILRDSMGNALSPYWSQQYTQTEQIQHRYDNWSTPPNYADLVEQYHPDVVIIQIAERHLVNAPTASSGF